ncbi:hypothetical protein [Vibrio paucivorans]
MTSDGIRIEELVLFGTENRRSSVRVSEPIKIINGASNTGKSYFISLIEFMLGREDVKSIKESKIYSECLLKITINNKPFSVYRKLDDIKFEVYNGFKGKVEGEFYSFFKVGKATNTVKNISEFYLGNLGVRGVKICNNLSGSKENLTIRTLSKVFVADEKSIIDDISPILTLNNREDTKYQNIFYYMLSGNDNSKIATLKKRTEFISEKKGKIDVLEDVVGDLENDLIFPNEDKKSLEERQSKLKDSIVEVRKKISNSQGGLSDVLEKKKLTSQKLDKINYEIRNLKVNEVNFIKLNELYEKDIERLSSQEEAAFLLKINHRGVCGSCGSVIEQRCNDISEINKISEASLAEIEKIKDKKNELSLAIISTAHKKQSLEPEVTRLSSMLKNLDVECDKRAPEIKRFDEDLGILRHELTKVSIDLRTHDRLSKYKKRLQKSELDKAPKPYNKDVFKVDEGFVHKFCKKYQEVLNEIKFPGENKVEFDSELLDVVIDGNPRESNGKGVKAILHSVFKIALMLHCREESLFHPGLILLDSPLVTYRDPVTHKLGELSEDEAKLSETSVRFNFLNYLTKISHLAQFIIVENIDIPEQFRESHSVETFYGANATNGLRKGLLV